MCVRGSMWLLTKGGVHQMRILIIKWKGASILWIPVSPFPDTPVLVQWAQNKVAIVPRMEVIHGLSNMDFHSPTPSWLWPLMHAHSASSRDQPWDPNMALFLGVISQLPDSRLIMLDHFNQEDAGLCSFWNTQICSYSTCRFAYSTVSDQGTHLTAKQVWQWARPMEFIGLTMFPTILKQQAWQNSAMAFRRLSYSVR